MESVGRSCGGGPKAWMISVPRRECCLQIISKHFYLVITRYVSNMYLVVSSVELEPRKYRQLKLQFRFCGVHCNVFF